MNKYLFTCILITLLAIKSTAQKIHFTDTTNVWHILRSGFAPSGPNLLSYHNQIIRFKKHVIHNAQTYNLLSGDSVLVREDTVAKKVYAIVYENRYFGGDTAEFVLYDYNLSTGDTFTVVKTNANNNQKYFVKNVDSIQINGNWYKVFTLSQIIQNGNTTTTYTYIEGIGCINEPVLPYFGFYFEEYARLACFENQNTFPILSKAVQGFDNAKSCADTSLKVSNLAKGTLTIFPQPSNGRFTIRLNETIQHGQITVLNNMGQIVYQKDITGTGELIINDPAIANGLFHFKITDYQTGESFTGNISIY